YTLELIALRRISGAVFSILVSLEPAFAAAAGLILLDQQLTGYRAVTIVLVICASAGITWSQNHYREPAGVTPTPLTPPASPADSESPTDSSREATTVASPSKTISSVTSPRDSSGHSAR
ncbi:MAG: EamA family transporter, partial [Corynebacterium variabile]